MKKPEIFLDSSALIAGIVSAQGAARVLLLLAENEKIELWVSEQVIAEVERNLARKAPRALPVAREMILRANIQILHDPKPADVRSHMDWINHAADVPILVAAANAQVDFLVTLDVRHFIDDPVVAQRSGLRIGTPGDALIWVREWFVRNK
ncbi:predicted nucleic-acid-binding protein, contains PIN domain [Longilinea arvoryzae]|uniref:Predicted nucleic-acid-binding protein, contains PIN domain n=2 Tax=Longilinea arvoryzae TaxID=360412 RepID=A0A0S7BDG2_9CHLR|nr:predicted nucleic-acid-binding protein, contains PIN domain [Longilinea arvoryzae]